MAFTDETGLRSYTSRTAMFEQQVSRGVEVPRKSVSATDIGVVARDQSPVGCNDGRAVRVVIQAEQRPRFG